MIKYLIALAALAALAISASASSRMDAVYVNPKTGSDSNNCRVSPVPSPPPPAISTPCKTVTHAATLLTGPGSAILLENDITYNELAMVMVDAKRFPSVGAALAIGRADPDGAVLFDGGGFILHGDGWLAGPRGVRMQNCPSDCIAPSGISATAPLHGGIENETVNSSFGHVINMTYTVNFELGYNFFKNSDKSHLFISNSPNFNIHETSLLEDVKKVPQLGGYVINSPNGLYDTHVDVWTAPTALSAVNSRGLHDPIVDTPRMGNVCPASDVATDTFSSSWTKITSVGCQ